MYSAERTYRTGRGVISFLEFLSWIVVGVGALSVILGFVGAGAVFGGFRGETPILLRVFAMIPGLVTAAIGLFFIMQCQHTKSVLDTAEMTRELLAEARRSGSPSGSTSKPSVAPTSSAQDSWVKRDLAFQVGSTIKVYKGYAIRKEETGVSVSGSPFANVISAERFIDELEAKS